MFPDLVVSGLISFSLFLLLHGIEHGYKYKGGGAQQAECQ